ncbi:MAG: HypC/HybG/HupF family hydrogenase formation chaperone [Elusimicrobiota bacterium]|nr:HypC/HybG/HupF family hydrogenase formation chaperone [Elusimicrobiota bacterium]
MCLAVPVKIVGIDKEGAVGEVAGVRREVNTSFLTDLEIGDYVLLHAGFAIQKVDPDEAKETLRIWADLKKEEDK